MKNTRTALRHYRRRIQSLKGQIATANKILDQFLDLYSAHYEINTKLMDQLRTVLSTSESHFMKPTACTYKKDVPNCAEIDCNDCPHIQKKEK